jgi:hypothetical protein
VLPKLSIFPSSISSFWFTWYTNSSKYVFVVSSEFFNMNWLLRRSGIRKEGGTKCPA